MTAILPKYLGDEYLLMEKLFNDSNTLEYLLRRNSMGLPINQKQLTYESGHNMGLIAMTMFVAGVNRVWKADPDKYSKIWRLEDERYPYERRIKLVFDTTGVKPIKQEDTPYQ